MVRRSAATEKVTISLPESLVRYANQRARQLGISRSQVIADALIAQQARETEELAAEGYRFYAEEARAFAAASAPAVAEALRDDG